MKGFSIDMSELIITIKGSALKKNRFLLLETYYTRKVDANKSGNFKGGAITPADLSDAMPVENCDIKSIKKWLEENCFRLSANGYYISVESLNKLVDYLHGNRMIFLDNKDKSLTLIEKVVEEKSGKKKPKFSYQSEMVTIAWYNDCSLYIAENASMDFIKKCDPISKLQYSQKETIYYLSFDYCGVPIAFMDKALFAQVNDTVYLRNYNYEYNTYQELLKENFTKLSDCKFKYAGQKSKSNIKQFLSTKNISVQFDENIILPKVKINRENDGWFDIDLSYDKNGETLDLASKINLFAENGTMEIDGEEISLPESILQAREYLKLEGNKLRLHQNHIIELLRIAYDSDVVIDQLLPYSDTKLYISDEIKNTAFPYQLDGIRWLKFLYLNHFGGCLADDMGLGKTFQIISFLQDDEVKKSVEKVLIIVPKSLLTNWKKEFEKFHSDYKVEIYHGNNRNEFDFENTEVIITTYNTAYLDLKILNEQNYSVVVFDEIQYVKNKNSITSDAMKQIQARIKIGLSGTPMENNISELWNIMDILNPNVFYSHTAFMKRYKGNNYDELKSILNLFILRRMKKDVLKELPEKTEEIIYCDMDDEQRKLYSAIKIAVKQAVLNMCFFDASLILKELTLLRECCCHPMLLNEETNVDQIEDACKMEQLNILIENLVQVNHKILIFSNYTSMLKIIQDELMKSELYKGIIYYLDGKTKNRQELVEQFEAADAGVFLISIKAGGTGLNLVSAQDVIIYDPWWNPFTEEQAIDRAYRIGQKNSVSVYKLVTVNTLEEKIIAMQQEKKQAFDDLINGVSVDKNFSLRDVLNLLE